MECFGSIKSWIVGKVGDYAFEPVGRQLGYIIHYKCNVGKLIAETQDLNLVKERMHHLVDDAKSKGEEIHGGFKDLLNQVDDIVKEAKKVLGDENYTEIIKCTFRGSLKNLVEIYKISRKAKRMCECIVKIKCEIRLFDNISYSPKLQVSNFGNKEYIAFDTRKEIVSGIMEALGDGSIKMIGVYGVPGVGKTTLVKEISKRALVQGLFDRAVLVNVSQNPNLEKIQEEVADGLDIQLDNKMNLSEKALQLRNRLKYEKKFLIILDDVSKEVNLLDMGIVFESDHDQKGSCKILLTSRYEQVLHTDMGVEQKFEVELVSENEAWNWFSHIVGNLADGPNYKDCGTKIVKECGCLPISIVTISHALKSRGLCSWRNALEQVEKSNLLSEKMYSLIKLCYDCIESNEAKSLLLLCSLHEDGASIKITDLMRYGMGLDMFEGVRTWKAIRKRVYGLVSELKDRHLLLDGDDLLTVKMHDVIRDAAISIAKERRHMYSFRDGAEVEACLKKKKLEYSTAISLPNGFVDQLICENLEYKQLGLIWMQESKASQIPDRFFERTKALRVLTFCDQNLAVLLPPSLCFLKNLSTLFLRGCKLADISLIGELSNLEILDLSRSSIKELPRQIGQLTHLRVLDLSDCEELRVIHPNVISNLTRLEELNMLDTFPNWEVVNGENGNASLIELKELDQLTSLDLEIPDIKILPKDLFSDKLERYNIFILDKEEEDDDDDDDDDDDYIDSDDVDTAFFETATFRFFAIKLKHKKSNDILQEHGLEILLKKSHLLYLKGLEDVSNIVYELETEGLSELKWFFLANDDKIQYLVNSIGKIHPCSAFGSLEALWLNKLMNLENICHGELPVKSFKRLRVIKVKGCMKLKNLLPFSIAKQPEKIKIVDCEMMEEIFTHAIDDDEEEELEEFPRLCSLTLRNVSKLRQFCSKLKKVRSSDKEEEPLIVHSDVVSFFNEKHSFPKLETMELFGCNFKKIWDNQLPSSSNSFCNLTTLLVKRCKFLKNLFSSAMAASFEQLCYLEISACWALEEIMSRNERMDKMSFPKLRHMKLQGLCDLVTFSSSIYIEFPVLTGFCIEDCPVFETFISNSEEKLCTTMTSLFNENVALPSLTSLKIKGIHELNMIWQNELSAGDSFCKLEEVKVEYCHKITKIFPSSMQRRICNLTRLEIRDCRMVEEVFEIQMPNVEETYNIIPSQLIHLRLESLSKLKYVWCKDPNRAFTFPHLKEVEASKCPSLKSVFPSSIAKGLFQLQRLDIWDSGIEEIVSVEEGLGSTIQPEFVFPRLEEMKLTNLPFLVCFYPGLHTSCFPLLSALVVQDCEEMKAFALEFFSFQEMQGLALHDKQIQQPLFDQKFASLTKLENFEMSGFHLKNDQLLHQPSSTSFHNLTKLAVIGCNYLEYLFSSLVATSFVQLYSLEIRDCEMMEEIMSNKESMNKLSFPKLNHLNLQNLPSLATFSSAIFTEFPMLTEFSIEDCPEIQTFISKSEENNFTTMPLSFFNEKVAFPSLNYVKIIGMDKLKMIWDYELVTADSFCKLEDVKVKSCKNLMRIFPYSMQKRLHNLTRLNIDDCEMVEVVFEIQMSNIVEEPNHITPASQLKYLDLRSLSKLKYVWSRDTQGTLTFPNLKEVVAHRCPTLKSIFPPSVAKELFQLHKLHIQNCGIEEIVGKEEALETVPPGFVFPKLEVIILVNLPNLVSLYPGLHTSTCPLLRKIDVVDCMKMKVFASEFFNFQETHELGTHHDISLPFFLVEKTQTLQVRLPSMIMISPPEFTEHIFGNLEEINVFNCKNLTRMFSYNVLRSLHNLSKLFIRNCEMMEEVFEIEIVNDHHQQTSKTTPIHLKELRLLFLPKLKHVWSKGPQGTLTFQDLQTVEALACKSLKSLFPASVAKNLPQLQYLHVANCGIEQIVAKEELLLERIPSFVFPHLQSLTLHNLPKLVSFYPGLHTIKWPMLRWLHVSYFMKLKDLSLNFLSFQETFGMIHQDISFQEPLFSIDKVTFASQYEDQLVGGDKEYAGTLSHLSGLRLYDMPNLLHLREESSQPQSVFQNLIDLDVLRCGRIKKLVSSSMSFQNLISLKVTQCHGMLSLLPSQTAKSMERVERLTICDCKRMTEIIADMEEDGDDDMEGEIVFGRLKTLTLDYLPSLTSFYSGKYMIGFPDLRSVFVNRCFEMKSFSEHGNIISSLKFHKLVLDYDTTMFGGSSIINRTISQYWESHPSTALQQLFTDKNVGYDEEDDFDDEFDDEFDDDEFEERLNMQRI